MNTQLYKDLAAKGNEAAQKLCRAIDDDGSVTGPAEVDGHSAEVHAGMGKHFEEAGSMHDAISSFHKAAVAHSKDGNHEGVVEAIGNAHRLHGGDCDWLKPEAK
jgi:hypothetical protein